LEDIPRPWRMYGGSSSNTNKKKQRRRELIGKKSIRGRFVPPEKSSRRGTHASEKGGQKRGAYAEKEVLAAGGLIVIGWRGDQHKARSYGSLRESKIKPGYFIRLRSERGGKKMKRCVGRAKEPDLQITTSGKRTGYGRKAK